MSLRRVYGAGPLHLLSTLAALAVAAYAFTRIFAGAQPGNVVAWFVGALIVHDLIAFPLYTALDRMARGGRTRGVNYVRVPALLAGLAFIVFAPLILGLGDGRYERATSLSHDVYLGRWLLLCGALFAGSALLYAVRTRRM
jgi:fumarate reductase subunit D